MNIPEYTELEYRLKINDGLTKLLKENKNGTRKFQLFTPYCCPASNMVVKCGLESEKLFEKKTEKTDLRSMEIRENGRI